MVGEVIELGCRDGCGQKGGWSSGRRRSRLQWFPPLEINYGRCGGGVRYSKREDEMVSFGSLKALMKSHTVKTLKECKIHLEFGLKVSHG